MKDLYEFEYGLMPYLIEQCSDMKLDPKALTDKDFIRGIVERNFGKVHWNWDEFQVKVYDIGGNPVIIYRFPEPDMAPLARFAAAVADKNGLKYYTLEYDDFGNKVTWHFCRKYQGGHDNFGEVDECVTMEEFANLISGRILKISKTGDQKSWLARILDFFKR